MEVKGKIIQKLEPVSGTSKAGNSWSKQEYVLETLDSYPKKVFFDFFGERASQYPLEVGDVVTLSFDIESREYNGRWYTSIRGWKAEKENAAASQAAPGIPADPAQTLQGAAEPLPNFTAPSSAGGEDLPF